MHEPWLNETYQIHSILVSQGRQNCPRHCGETKGTGEVKILLRGHSHLNSALVIEQGWGGRGIGELQSCNSLWGLGTYTRGWEILSSYVYYYFFSSNLARGRSVTLSWVRRACRWVGKEPFSWRRPLTCQGMAGSTAGPRLLFRFKEKGFLREQLYLQ